LKRATVKKTRRERGIFLLNIAIHPTLRSRLKAVAADEGVTMVEKLHEILCKELGRPDLADKVPMLVAS
jgi:hypothetical protein